MTDPSSGRGGQVLLSALAPFVSMLLEGRTPAAICSQFYGANLIALAKKGGGVQPITVGCTLRRLTTKVDGDKVMDKMAELLSPRQLGYGIRRGDEATFHACRLYCRIYNQVKLS